ncbi:hypothetical protein B296_00045002 [Ensete ventricosum]|uniref:Uncharacterized protein n=1 Tax=Ensete ventricosum TaxID=4639 RepID=A0A426X3Y4_ENSVE|nr:hypothetical protein B296_00045002 [Ensete ventricosum]
MIPLRQRGKGVGRPWPGPLQGRSATTRPSIGAAAGAVVRGQPARGGARPRPGYRGSTRPRPIEVPPTGMVFARPRGAARGQQRLS